eukprot:SAG31_NODE_1425_length_8386_cov_6.678201_2_plen_1474_part_00
MLQYISTLNTSIDPSAAYDNALRLQVFKMCDKLLRAGNYSLRPHDFSREVALGGTKYFHTLTSDLIQHVQVDNDVPFDNAQVHHWRNQLVVDIKLELVGMIEYIYRVWQSTRVDYIVSEYAKFTDRADNGAASTFEMEGKEEVHNPLSDSAGNGNASKFAEYITADISEVKLIAQEQADSLTRSLSQLAGYDDMRLKSLCFETLFDQVMIDRALVVLMSQCQIITDAAETKQYLAMEDMYVQMETHANRLAVATAAEIETVQVHCTAAVDAVVRACGDRLLRIVMIDLNFHARICNIIETCVDKLSDVLDVRLSKLSEKCISILTMFAESSKGRCEKFADAGMQSLLQAVGLSALQKLAIKCIQAIISENRTICERYFRNIIEAFAHVITPAILLSDVHLLLLEVIPTLVKNRTEFYERIQLVVAAELMAMPGFLVLECEPSSILSAKNTQPWDQLPLSARIYQKSLEALAICCEGHLSAVEIICEGLLPSEICVGQLLALHDLEVSNESISTATMFVQHKRALMAFLLHVFVDTSSDKLLYKLKKPRNGFWLTFENLGTRSIMQMILQDLRLLTGEQYMRDMPPAHMHYVFEICLPVVYKLLVNTSIHNLQKPDEYSAALAAVDDLTLLLQKCAEKVQQHHTDMVAMSVVPDSPAGVAQIVSLVNQACCAWREGVHIQNSPFPSYISLKLCWSRESYHSDRTVYHNRLNENWQVSCQAVVDAIHIKRKTPVTGHPGLWQAYTPSGMDAVARLLWKYNRASDLVKVMQTERHARSPDRMLNNLDAIRMMLYVVPGATEPVHRSILTRVSNSKVSSEIQAFLEGLQINIDDPHVANAQELLCKFGLLEACLRVANDEGNSITSPALRLLRALLDGDSQTTLNLFLHQLNNSEDELLVESFGVFLSKTVVGIEDIRSAALSGSYTAYIAAVRKARIIQSGELIALVSAACAGNNAKRMQDYIREQPERDGNGRDGIPLLEEYLGALRPHFSAAFRSELEYGKLSDQKTPALNDFHTRFVIGHAILCIDAMADLIRGPNELNKASFLNGSIVKTISSIVEAIDLDRFKSPGGKRQSINLAAFKSSDEYSVLFRIAEFLYDFLAGPPNEQAERCIVEGLNWSKYAELLNDVFETLSEVGKDKLGQLGDAEQKVVRLMAELFGICERLSSSTKYGVGVSSSALAPVYQGKVMCTLYQQLTQSVEVTLDGKLQQVSFPVPLYFLKKNMKGDFAQIMDSCPLTDPKEKLVQLQENMLEYMIGHRSEEAAYEWDGWGINASLVRANEVVQSLVGLLTLGLNLLLLLAYRPGSCPTCPETYVSTTAYVAWLILAPLHVITCVLKFTCWVATREPVLTYRRDRSEELESLKREDNPLDYRQNDGLFETLSHAIDTSLTIQTAAVVAELPTSLLKRVPVFGKIVNIVGEPECLMQLLSISTAILGLTINPLFQSFALAHVVYNSDLEIVIRSIAGNCEQLQTGR